MNILPHAGPHLPAFFSWPKTRAGMVAAWLGLLTAALVIASFFTATYGSQAGLVQLESLLMIVAAPVSIVAALIAILRHHERSIFLWIPLFVGALFLAFVGVEIFVGHD